MRGDLPTAEARLSVLAKICSRSCDEREDFEKAVARFKANRKLEGGQGQPARAYVRSRSAANPASPAANLSRRR